MKNQKGIATIVMILIIIGILVLVGGIYYYKTLKEVQPKACTLEAKICPDGTTVGRTGPNCEFAECPSTKGYLYHTPSECAVVKYKCDDGYKSFNNDLGCGCEKISNQEECVVDSDCYPPGFILGKCGPFYTCGSGKCYEGSRECPKI